MRRRAALAWLLLAAGLQPGAAWGSGQDLGIGDRERLSGPGQTSEFIYRTDTEESLMPVYLLGAVMKPGLYHIPVNMDVVGLLTIAGGTAPEAEIQHVMVRGQTPSTQGRKVQFDLREVVQGGAESRVNLMGNDLVFVPPGRPPVPFSQTLLTIITITAGVLGIAATGILLSQSR